MGKRRRGSERRLHKRPKPSSSSSPVGGGGGGGGVGGGARVPTTPSSGVPAGTAPSSRGVRPATGPPESAAPGLSPSATPSTSSSRSSGTRSPGLAAATGRPQLPPRGPWPPPPPAGGGAFTPPATPSSSSSSSGGGGTPMANHPPPFLTRRVNPPTPRLQCEKRMYEADHLLVYMESNCKEQADELWNSGKWHLKIDFNDLKSFHRERSYMVCNNYNPSDSNNHEGGEEYYASAMRTFLLEHFKKKSLDEKFASIEDLALHIEERGNLSFTHMPKSIMRFIDIPHKSMIVKLFAGQKYGLDAVESRDVARQLLCKIFEHMLDNHKKGWCWDGNWTVEDWEVINGKYVNFLATAIRSTGRDHLDKDLNQLANSVLPEFKLNGVLPTFMQHLQDELLNLPGKPGDSQFARRIISDMDFFGWYYTYIKFHPALMSPLARSTLLEGLYFCMEKLDYKKLNYYKSIAELSWQFDWRKDFHPPKLDKVNKVHYDVFWYRRTPCTDVMPHENNYVGMLGYHRHVVQHSPDNGRTQWFKGEYVQTMKNSDESELMAARHDETLLPKWIKNLLSLNFMKQREFSKRFDQYMASWGT